MKYNHAMAEREYKREWKAAKLEMRKAGMQRKQIREAARAYRLEFNGERRFYRRTDVVPACEREDRPPKGVDTLFQESHSMHAAHTRSWSSGGLEAIIPWAPYNKISSTKSLHS